MCGLAAAGAETRVTDAPANGSDASDGSVEMELRNVWQKTQEVEASCGTLES